MHHDLHERKESVRTYWNTEACGTGDPSLRGITQYSRDYYDRIESARYDREPEIFSFAQFTRARGKKVLEVGVGAGTDFLQWSRAGAEAHGIDLTPEGVAHTERRLALEGLSAADLRVADCESLPFPENTFDVVYSWGVIHHTPDTARALSEIVRVCRPGGRCVVMIYNRHSLVSYGLWVRRALFALRPWRSLRWCIAHYMESIGTQAFTVAEATAMLAALSTTKIRVTPIVTYYDRFLWRGSLVRTVAYVLCSLLPRSRAGWFLVLECEKRGT